ncbi:MAG: FliI/YscN family ATPase [Oscillospiraceae bacterium]|jgi:flagellum-specific ATP synthase|nr:FliI/YscN family ATPase [Oscillospiraceae bacterium]
MSIDFTRAENIVRQGASLKYSGSVQAISGLTVEAGGPAVQIGEMCRIYTLAGDRFMPAEVVGFRDKRVLLMPYGDLVGVGPGSRVVSTNRTLSINVSEALKGRVVDGLGNPMDGGAPINPEATVSAENMPPNPLDRPLIVDPLPMGVRAIDGLLTCGRGQRIGIFAGSGVGKSTLLGMIARNAKSDVNVITLIGERGREVNGFLRHDLGEEGLKRSVVVVASSDQPALIRAKSALTGTRIAEYFRDKGYNVLLMMDSLTRYAMAQREVGMAAGEPPVSRGYTPSVYTVMPKLLERTGNAPNGSITALYTVLVEGDDLNEPITDTARGILDGHIVLSRAMANRNHYPAIDVLASISRLMPDVTKREHYKQAGRIKSMMAVYRDAQDIINIGAYKSGSNPDIDASIKLNKPITEFLQQDVDDGSPFETTLERLMKL